MSFIILKGRMQFNNRFPRDDAISSDPKKFGVVLCLKGRNATYFYGYLVRLRDDIAVFCNVSLNPFRVE